MEDHKLKKSEYELRREERIRENRERMGKLGILDISLSLKLKPNPNPNPSSRPTASKNPKSLNNPSRRSTRLQNVAPIQYTEEAINKRIYGKKRVKKTRPKLLPEGYTWRKYGRKVIKGLIRDYSKCSMVSNCPARKYEDRSLDDPTAIIVTYNGKHIHPSF